MRNTNDVYVVRNPGAQILGTSESIGVFNRSSKARLLEQITPIHRMLLDRLTKPEHLPDIRLEPFEEEAVQLALTSLIDAGALLRGTKTALESLFASPTLLLPPKIGRLVWAISGTIQAASMIDLIPVLRTYVAEQVHVILTPSAKHFVQAEVFAYFGVKVWTSERNHEQDHPVLHMHLAESADAILVMPASARTIHRLATGECSDLLSLVIAATKAPIIVCPSMNPQMLLHPPIARNVEQLRRDGIFVAYPGLGTATSDPARRKVFISAPLRDPASIAGAISMAQSCTNKRQDRSPA